MQGREPDPSAETARCLQHWRCWHFFFPLLAGCMTSNDQETCFDCISYDFADQIFAKLIPRTTPAGECEIRHR